MLDPSGGKRPAWARETCDTMPGIQMAGRFQGSQRSWAGLLVGDPEEELPRPQPSPGGEEALVEGPHALRPPPGYGDGTLGDLGGEVLPMGRDQRANENAAGAKWGRVDCGKDSHEASVEKK